MVSRLKRALPTRQLLLFISSRFQFAGCLRKELKAKMRTGLNFPAVSYNVTLDTTDVIHASIDEVTWLLSLKQRFAGDTCDFPVLQNWRRYSLSYHSGVSG